MAGILPRAGRLVSGEITMQESTASSSRTYRVDFDTGRLGGFVDGEEAMRQAIGKMLNTQRWGYEIYGPNYGMEIIGLLGNDREWAESEARRRIREALLSDARIQAVEEFEFFDGETPESMRIRFRVVTADGVLESEVVI